LWTWKDREHTHKHLKYRVRQAWKETCEALGIEGRILHDFRRTAIRNMEARGISRFDAMALTGHRSQEVHRRYAINETCDLEAAVARLSGTQVAHDLEEMAQ
jgi:integrase